MFSKKGAQNVISAITSPKVQKAIIKSVTKEINKNSEFAMELVKMETSRKNEETFMRLLNKMSNTNKTSMIKMFAQSKLNDKKHQQTLNLVRAQKNANRNRINSKTKAVKNIIKAGDKSKLRSYAIELLRISISVASVVAALYYIRSIPAESVQYFQNKMISSIEKYDEQIAMQNGMGWSNWLMGGAVKNFSSKSLRSLLNVGSLTTSLIVSITSFSMDMITAITLLMIAFTFITKELLRGVKIGITGIQVANSIVGNNQSQRIRNVTNLLNNKRQPTKTLSSNTKLVQM